MKLDASSCDRAGNIQNYLESWKKITSDRVTIDIVRNGLKKVNLQMTTSLTFLINQMK